MMACCEVYAPMRDANIKKILHSIGDPYGLALRPQTEEVENRLEVPMPEEELPEMEDLLQLVGGMEPISDKTNEILIAMVDHTAEAYHYTAQAAEQFTELARACSMSQLMVIM